ncbi:MAG: SRPBCC family protein [Polyangiales bacterium]
MRNRDDYTPGPAAGASVERDGDRWTLVLVRELRHAPEKVWAALTEPAQLSQWAPFDADRNLSTTGTVRLSTVGAPDAQPTESTVTRAEAPRLLEFGWGGNTMRWELEATATGTRLKLWHAIPRGYIAWGAAGWHICFDVLDALLSDATLGRIVGPDAMHFDWQRLNTEYAAQLGVESPSWSPKNASA